MAGSLAAEIAAAPYCARLGVVVEALEPDRARIRIPYKDENSNPGKALHGGVAAAIGEDIVAEGRVLRRGKELVYADVDVRNEAGKWIAKGLVTYRALDRPAAGDERQRVTRAGPPTGEGEDVPPLARAIVSVPFIKSLGMRITRMTDGHAILRMPRSPEKADHLGAIHEGALA